LNSCKRYFVKNNQNSEGYGWVELKTMKTNIVEKYLHNHYFKGKNVGTRNKIWYIFFEEVKMNYITESPEDLSTRSALLQKYSQTR